MSGSLGFVHWVALCRQRQEIRFTNRFTNAIWHHILTSIRKQAENTFSAVLGKKSESYFAQVIWTFLLNECFRKNHFALERTTLLLKAILIHHHSKKMMLQYALEYKSCNFSLWRRNDLSYNPHKTRILFIVPQKTSIILFLFLKLHMYF